jgi:hypothetical protein
MRDSITHQDEGYVQTSSRGVITIKLFNFMLAEVGPLLLKRGIRLDVTGLASLLNDPSVRHKMEEVRLANQEVAVDTLGGMLAGEQMILLCVNSLDRADTE